ncbi:MAG: Actin-fragmin kinase, catalytic [Pseudomonadota bacterium]|jgi:hypothetical protein
MRTGRISIETAAPPQIALGASDPASSVQPAAEPDSLLLEMIGKVKKCQRVGFADSSTGAHYGMDESSGVQCIVKKNDEWLFEYLGNDLAIKLGVRVPEWGIVDRQQRGYAHLSAMLPGDLDHPLIVAKAIKSINIKEVGAGRIADPIECCQQLGRAFFLDAVIGNWDRFPVFPNDDHGNYGNIIYEKDQKRLWFIDNVARKCTELAGSNYNFGDLLLQCEAHYEGIQNWLGKKFEDISPAKDCADAFREGIVCAGQAFQKHLPEFDDTLQVARQSLEEQDAELKGLIAQEIALLRQNFKVSVQAESTEELEAAKTHLKAVIHERLAGHKKFDDILKRVDRGGAILILCGAQSDEVIGTDAYKRYSDLIDIPAQQKAQRELSAFLSTNERDDALASPTLLEELLHKAGKVSMSDLDNCRRNLQIWAEQRTRVGYQAGQLGALTRNLEKVAKLHFL